MSIDQNISRSSFKVSTLAAVILLIAVIVGISAFVLPLKAKFDETSSALNKKDVEINILKTQLSEIQALEASFTGGEVTQMDVLNLIPQGVNEDKVINALARSADETEVSLNSLGFSMGQGRDVDSQVLNITLNVSGSRNGLLDFLAKLETAPRKFRVNTITIQSLENNLENMSVNVEAFFL
jgi:hypothetical protein